MNDLSPLSLLAIVCHSLGVLHAVGAVFFVRSAQGAIAWVFFLVIFPYAAIPLFWGFGPRRFYGYQKKIAAAHRLFESKFEYSSTERNILNLPEEFTDDRQFLESLAQAEFCSGNALELYTDGTTYFDEIFSQIEQAKEYILVQFFIVRMDILGKRFAKLLVQKAAEGVSVYFLYDQIGSFFLPKRYTEILRSGGVRTAEFKTNIGVKNPFLLNFRNHRKLVLCDGDVVFFGGSNLGDEYLGKGKRFAHWRDTNVRLSGPATMAVQRSFARDWLWATGEPLEQLNWNLPVAERKDLTCLAIHTGPTSSYDEGSLLFLDLFSLAQKRIWIATPYFVPDEGILNALQLAVLRGIDVRIILPAQSDHLMVFLASCYYARAGARFGIGVYRYKKGFLHEKVVLVDDEYSLIGTANLDTRSLHTNFELSLLTCSVPFAKRVEEMLLADMAQSSRIDEEFYEKENPLFVFATRFARLFSPVL